MPKYEGRHADYFRLSCGCTSVKSRCPGNYVGKHRKEG